MLRGELQVITAGATGITRSMGTVDDELTWRKNRKSHKDSYLDKSAPGTRASLRVFVDLEID